MLDSTTGDCWICGNVTKTKCGPCAESGIDIFFCSKEHQKLVWYAHKRVCGAPAKEFALPSFDDEESQLYTALLSARLSTSNPGNEPINEMDELSLRRMMMLLLKVPETELLSRGLPLLQNASILPSRSREKVLQLMRSTLVDLVTTPIRYHTQFSVLSPFCHLAWLTSTVHADFPSPPSSDRIHAPRLDLPSRPRPLLPPPPHLRRQTSSRFRARALERFPSTEAFNKIDKVFLYNIAREKYMRVAAWAFEPISKRLLGVKALPAREEA